MIFSKNVYVLLLLVRFDTLVLALTKLDYTWKFRGRFIFAPALVSSVKEAEKSVNPFSLFGWTLGGWVALEYDESPVGPYYEVVEMASLVNKRGYLGQWGKKLHVSSKKAAEACQDIWNLPAIFTNISFSENHDTNDAIQLSSTTSSFQISNWKKTRFVRPSSSTSLFPRLSTRVLWTPEIKALWIPLQLPILGKNEVADLSLHQLRISAAALRLVRFQYSVLDDRLLHKEDSSMIGEENKERTNNYFSLGYALVADDLLIEIADNQNGDVL